ncbi:MAG: alpha-glucan family phosphorylase [Planctomycetota bacterium]|nr:alpha-glucan family phosphorylase [Planctomycetota bacterium]MDA1138867.1 alpha-glucan family phosphorylase [Planctomycetota bacterium]
MRIREFSVHPSLPENLKPLETLAYNLRWSWDPEVVDLFRRLDRDLWEASYHNPILFLGRIKQDRLLQASQDDGILTYLERMVERHHAYMSGPSWFQRSFPDQHDVKIAYFCAEFGIAECLPIFSGGLGMLAGDHLKSASDLGLPLVGVGLLYQRGYFRQYLNNDGWQQESTGVNDFFNMPLKLVRHHEDGSPLEISLPFLGRTLKAQVWRVEVGRVPLYLLDSNVPDNTPEDRQITDQLYGGDNEKRIRQEILLGIGGLRALDALGIRPEVCHLNEGHSAFLALERTRRLMENHHLSFEEAAEVTASGNVFTTHTPVPAGFDLFPPELMEKYFRPFWESIRLSKEQFLALGRDNPGNEHAWFNMALLAIRFSGTINAVSKLHGQVTREKVLGIAWPNVPKNDVPITHVTNGVHVNTWISRDISDLLQRYIGRLWQEGLSSEDWSRIQNIPDEELWRTHERGRERLVASARRRYVEQLVRRGAPRVELDAAREALHPEALTIGFARRFATYKRANLILKDVRRLKKILTNKERPVQIIFAGKAHPADNLGKQFIREIVHFSRDPEIMRRVIFLENYDMDVARDMLQGVDVWLNTPRRLMEASGTSGMKAAINGALNLSVLDGWWYEGYSSGVGWAIGEEEEYGDPDYQDLVESQALYDILEHEVIPTFYDREADDLPREWIGLMKNTMKELGPVFNTRRMVREYATKLYLPTAERWKTLRGNGEYINARNLSGWKAHLRAHWNEIRLVSENNSAIDHLKVGEGMEISATISIRPFAVGDLSIEVYSGTLDANAKIVAGAPIPMTPVPTGEEGVYVYAAHLPCTTSGRWGYAVRVLPKHQHLMSPYDLGLIHWF